MQTNPNQSALTGGERKPSLSAAELAQLSPFDRVHIGLGYATEEDIRRLKAGAAGRVVDARTAYTKDEIDRLPPAARVELGLSRLGRGKDPDSAVR